jgi:RNA polymerase sigma-70 factor, ECF subfamily
VRRNNSPQRLFAQRKLYNVAVFHAAHLPRWGKAHGAYGQIVNIFNALLSRRKSAGPAGAGASLDDFGAQVLPVIPRLRRYARALTSDTLQADDLVQDTLERALTKQHLWRQGSDLRAWMFTIMHNVFVNQVRARPADATVELDSEAYDIASRASPVDMLEIGDIDAAIRRLPPEQREVLLLVAVEQFSYVETAQALSIPVGTVMSRLYRARERVRALLSGEAAAGSTLKVVK